MGLWPVVSRLMVTRLLPARRLLTLSVVVALGVSGCAGQADSERSAEATATPTQQSESSSPDPTTTAPRPPSTLLVQSNDDFMVISPEGAAITRCQDMWNENTPTGGGMFDFDTGSWVDAGKVPLEERSRIEFDAWEGNAQCAPIVVDDQPGMVVLANIRVESQGLDPERHLGRAFLYEVSSPAEPVKEIELYDTTDSLPPFVGDLVTWKDGFAFVQTEFDENADRVPTARGFSAVTGEEIWSAEGISLKDTHPHMPSRPAGSTLWPYSSDRANSYDGVGVLDLATGDIVHEAEERSEITIQGPGAIIQPFGHFEGATVVLHETREALPIEGNPWPETNTSPDYLAMRIDTTDGTPFALKVVKTPTMEEVFYRDGDEVNGLGLREVDVVDHYLRLHKDDEMILVDLETGETVPEDEEAYVLAILPNGWGTAQVPSVGLKVQQALAYLRSPDEPFRHE